jgi:glucosamine-6-phosphate deaminase
MISKKDLLKEYTVDKLNINIYATSTSMGRSAASFVAGRLKTIIARKDKAHLLLATGASQFSFLQALQQIDLNWAKITTFHLDEYIGISPNHPASFRKYLHERIIDRVQPAGAYFLQGGAKDLQREIKRYERLLQSYPIDVACVGIGENGHLAFNDPSMADFDDPNLVNIVELDDRSRQQQVDEGWFDSLEDVPNRALSLSIPAIMGSNVISCVVPDRRKAESVYNTLHQQIAPNCPASILRTHPDATLFLDRQSASEL